MQVIKEEANKVTVLISLIRTSKSLIWSLETIQKVGRKSGLKSGGGE
jgi:hypothetical protein